MSFPASASQMLNDISVTLSPSLYPSAALRHLLPHGRAESDDRRDSASATEPVLVGTHELLHPRSCSAGLLSVSHEKTLFTATPKRRKHFFFSSSNQQNTTLCGHVELFNRRFRGEELR
jgi:hypothetical protein